MMRPLNTYGKKIGQCNICGIVGELTHDHIPPKGSVRIKQVDMFHLIDLLAMDRPQKRIKGRKSQSGVKYKTICRKCNGEVLGDNYDKEFKSLIDQAHRLLNSHLILPPVIEASIKPQRVMKAILGHLCSVGVNRYKKGPNTEKIRDYILDQALSLPNFIDIYYWVYPYKRQVLIRDAVLKDLRYDGQAYFWLMKFYPISFFVVWDNPINYTFPNLGRLSAYRSASINDVVHLPINLKNIPPEQWPEQPTDTSMILYGEGSMGAIESPNKKSIY